MRKHYSSQLFIVSFSFILVFISSIIAAEQTYEATPPHRDFSVVNEEDVINALQNLPPSPRLLLTDDVIESVRQKVQADPRWKLYYDALKNDADKSLNDPSVEYKLEGVRLLHVSRQALKRIFSWSFLFRYTGDEKYARRVEKELVAIASFKDWNPSHFLDVAEMLTATSIGYDSCKNTFSTENNQKIKEAIWNKGVLETRYFKGGWKRNTANWNQVCWCGNLYGSLALYNEDNQSPEEKKILVESITDSINGVTWSMSSYKPDGNYTEGPGYWGYGTGFNILLLGTLDTAFKTDFGLSNAEGFLQTIKYYEHVFGTTGDAFNYPDSGVGKMFEPTAFWFCSKLNDPNIVWNENQMINNAYLLTKGTIKGKGVSSFTSLIRSRVAVCALLWGPSMSAESITQLNDSSISNVNTYPPSELGYVGYGNEQCCVALFRNAWNKKAAYLGVKCGRPNAPHGHLDAGSFVYDDRGVRWLVELGPENYNKIEQLGMKLWNTSQNSDRWKLLRYNNFGHSVPIINNQLQLVDQKSFFVETQVGNHGKESFALIDLTPVYKNDALKVTRKTTLKPTGDLIIEDVIESLPNKEAFIERRFLTPAKVTIDNNKVVLSIPDPENTNSVLNKVLETRGNIQTSFSAIPCSTKNFYDAPNPGVTIVVEKSYLHPGQKAIFETTFTSQQ